MMTDDTPRQSARMPSVADMRVNAFPTPVYTAAGDVAKTCIRVCGRHEDESFRGTRKRGRTFMLSTGYMTACSVIPAWRRHCSACCLADCPYPRGPRMDSELTRAPAAMLTCIYLCHCDVRECGKMQNAQQDPRSATVPRTRSPLAQSLPWCVMSMRDKDE